MSAYIEGMNTALSTYFLAAWPMPGGFLEMSLPRDTTSVTPHHLLVLLTPKENIGSELGRQFLWGDLLIHLHGPVLGWELSKWQFKAV